MRIISGNFKGSSLHITKEKTTRPLKDMVRENIFNLLTHSNKIPLKFKESIILDLYSGTGSFGLECLSRNAKKVYFVENEKSAFQVLKKNIDKLKIKLKTEVFFYDVFGFLEKENILGLKFDIIFIDPPYKNKNMENLLILINKKKLLKKNGLIILHRNKTTEERFPEIFNVIEKRIYGLSKIIFGNFLT